MVQIQLEDSVAATLINHARARGMSVNEYIADLASREQQVSTERISGDEAIRLIDAESGPGNAGYDGTFTREDIYSDHD
jgi:hypothetical protein